MEFLSAIGFDESLVGGKFQTLRFSSESSQIRCPKIRDFSGQKVPLRLGISGTLGIFRNLKLYSLTRFWPQILIRLYFSRIHKVSETLGIFRILKLYSLPRFNEVEIRNVEKQSVLCHSEHRGNISDETLRVKSKNRLRKLKIFDVYYWSYEIDHWSSIGGRLDLLRQVYERQIKKNDYWKLPLFIIDFWLMTAFRSVVSNFLFHRQKIFNPIHRKPHMQVRKDYSRSTTD